jgi:hypothetical protein
VARAPGARGNKVIARGGSAPSGSSKIWNKRTILELILLAAVVWVAHYWYFQTFGLYEDDYSGISVALGWHLSDLGPYLKVIAGWPQGRPLHFLLPRVMVLVGRRLGGLSGIYVLGYLVHVTNVLLFYFWMRRIRVRAGAVIGAVVFGLFPANTSHIFLNHALGKFPSITFLLIATHLYLSDRKMLAHLCSAGCLLTHEPVYMVFLAVPLVGWARDRQLLKESVRHFGVWVAILVVYVGIRLAMGESRVDALVSGPESVTTALGQILIAMALGPAVSLGSFVLGPAWAVVHWRWELTAVCAACVLPFAWALGQVRASAKEDAHSRWALRAAIPGRETSGPESGRGRSVRLLMASIAMLSLAYTIPFLHFPPTDLAGRETSVHMAAAVGGALLFACVCSAALLAARTRRMQAVWIGLLTLYLALLVAYRFDIQLDFSQAWQNERKFWTAATALLPDVTNGTMIFVPKNGLSTTRFILTNSWADPIILRQIYQFPSDWATPPRLFVVSDDWTDSIVVDGGEFRWQVPAATWPPHMESLPQGNVILLEMNDGRLTRRFGSLTIRGKGLELKALPAKIHLELHHGTLYDYLIVGGQAGASALSR